MMLIFFLGSAIKRWQGQIWYNTEYKQTLQVCLERGYAAFLHTLLQLQ